MDLWQGGVIEAQTLNRPDADEAGMLLAVAQCANSVARHIKLNELSIFSFISKIWITIRFYMIHVTIIKRSQFLHKTGPLFISSFG